MGRPMTYLKFGENSTTPPAMATPSMFRRPVAGSGSGARSGSGSPSRQSKAHCSSSDWMNPSAGLTSKSFTNTRPSVVGHFVMPTDAQSVIRAGAGGLGAETDAGAAGWRLPTGSASASETTATSSIPHRTGRKRGRDSLFRHTPAGPGTAVPNADRVIGRKLLAGSAQGMHGQVESGVEA